MIHGALTHTVSTHRFLNFLRVYIGSALVRAWRRETHEGLAMPSSRQLRLGAFMRPASIHTGAWRYPGAFPDANFNFAHIKRFAQTLEAST